jgi:hypothetical protein
MQKPTPLFLVTKKTLADIPREAADDFKRWVLEDKLKPSVALRRLMDEYKCPILDFTAPIKLIQLTYPDIDFDRGGFRFRIVDSAYPNSDPKQFSDDDFDDGFGYLVAHPTEPGPGAIETVIRSFKDFEKWILEDKEKPSVALRRYMDKYHLLHTTTVIQFIMAVYPHIELNYKDFELRVLQSEYPICRPKQFSDDDFDNGIEEILALPNGGW